jgi:hypothetical protein
MNAQVRLFLAVMGTLTLLLATVFSAFAGGLDWRQPTALSAAPAGAILTAPETEAAAEYPRQADKCPDMQAMGVAEEALWFATDTDQVAYPDIVVDSYPAGTNMLAAGFEYNCIPRGTNITLVWKYGGFDQEPWVTSNTGLSPTSRPYVFHWSVYTTDKSPFIDSDYQVEIYWNDELLTEGEIILGDPGRTEGEDMVTVQGTIIDGKTKKPIKNARFFILEPGTTTDAWAKAKFPEDAVYSSAKSDADGRFVCDRKVERNVVYSVMVGAKGYKPLTVDNFEVSDDKKDPVDITIKLSK